MACAAFDMGLIEAVGVCNYKVPQLQQFHSLMLARDIPIASNQVCFSSDRPLAHLLQTHLYATKFLLGHSKSFLLFNKPFSNPKGRCYGADFLWQTCDPPCPVPSCAMS